MLSFRALYDMMNLICEVPENARNGPFWIFSMRKMPHLYDIASRSAYTISKPTRAHVRISAYVITTTTTQVHVRILLNLASKNVNKPGFHDRLVAGSCFSLAIQNVNKDTAKFKIRNMNVRTHM
jgi:hypothetical protein